MASASESEPARLVRQHGLSAALSTDGKRICVLGFASLVDKESALSTTPQASRFRHVRVAGFCRVFNLVSIINIRRGLAADRRLVTATARTSAADHIIGCAFEIPLDELPALLEREGRLRFVVARYESTELGAGGELPPQSSPSEATGQALLFAEFSDAEYLEERCGGDREVYQREVGQYYEGELYRADLLPVPSYLLRCLRAHARAGPQALANFLDASYLGNGTLLREYLLKTLERAGLPRVETGGHAVAHGPDETLADWSAEELEELDRIAHTCRAAARETH